MQHLTLDKFRATYEAGGILSVNLVAAGGEFYIEGETRKGEPALLVNSRDKEPRGFRNLQRAAALVRELGADHFRVEVDQWDPDAPPKVRRPDRSAAMKEMQAALEYDRWFRREVEKGVAAVNEAEAEFLSVNQVSREIDEALE